MYGSNKLDKYLKGLANNYNELESLDIDVPCTYVPKLSNSAGVAIAATGLPTADGSLTIDDVDEMEDEEMVEAVVELNAKIGTLNDKVDAIIQALIDAKVMSAV